MPNSTGDSSPIFLTLIALLLFGLGSPLAKQSYIAGGNATNLAASYGLLLLVSGYLCHNPAQWSTNGLVWAVFASLCMAGGYTLFNLAVGAGTTPISLLLPIIALNPFVGALLSGALLDEFKLYNLRLLFFGGVLMLCGLVVVFMAKKQ
jgi:drug/metabolite transporter (DMT)-like permease